jgi:hypothetical protein
MAKIWKGQIYCHNPTFGRVWGWHLDSRNGDLGVLRDSQNLKVRLQGLKHFALGFFFISLESYQSAYVENGLVLAIWTFVAQVMAKRKVESQNWQFDSRPLKVENWPDPGVCKWSATHRWKALKESYTFILDLISIRGLSKNLWPRKVPGVQIGTISRLLFRSPGTKSHSDVGAVERRREYYMGEGGGFPRIRAVVSLVSLGSPVACPNTKGAPESELTNVLVGLTQVRVSN